MLAPVEVASKDSRWWGGSTRIPKRGNFNRSPEKQSYKLMMPYRDEYSKYRGTSGFFWCTTDISPWISMIGRCNFLLKWSPFLGPLVDFFGGVYIQVRRNLPGFNPVQSYVCTFYHLHTFRVTITTAWFGSTLHPGWQSPAELWQPRPSFATIASCVGF